MCGIAGFQGNFDAGVLARMSEAIAHRGPDGCGAFHRLEHGIGLAHRRLAIIDLSHAADQPMCDEAAGLAIVFNGEIYNYRELRAELVHDGYTFRTQSDTEVVMRLYARDGEAIGGFPFRRSGFECSGGVCPRVGHHSVALRRGRG